MNTPKADRFAWQGHYDQRMAAAWERDGYLVLDGFVSPEDVARMRARADSLIEDFDIEAHKVVFSAKGQSHAASDYFMKSAANISFFLEEEAVDEDGRLLKDKGRAINKIGHALHDLDPVFADISHNADFEALSSGIGMADPLLLQSMVICKQALYRGRGEYPSGFDLHLYRTRDLYRGSGWRSRMRPSKTGACGRRRAATRLAFASALCVTATG